MQLKCLVLVCGIRVCKKNVRWKCDRALVCNVSGGTGNYRRLSLEIIGSSKVLDYSRITFARGFPRFDINHSMLF